jgi:hypothetical protein
LFVGQQVEEIHRKAENIMTFITTQTKMLSIWPFVFVKKFTIKNIVHFIHRGFLISRCFPGCIHLCLKTRAREHTPNPILEIKGNKCFDSNLYNKSFNNV